MSMSSEVASGTPEQYFANIQPLDSELADGGVAEYDLVIGKMSLRMSGLVVPKSGISLPYGTGRNMPSEYEVMKVFRMDEYGDMVTYETPLLEKPVSDEEDSDDDEIIFNRGFIEELLRSYAITRGIEGDEIDKFVADKMDTIDGIEKPPEKFPGQYL